jgi:hypothetical protein
VHLRLFSNADNKEVRFKAECNLQVNHEMVQLPGCPLPRKNIQDAFWTPGTCVCVLCLG